MPYTYLITHLHSGLKYYGVRYAKDSSPDDLWDTYFTSSKRIRMLIEADGVDAFVVDIRKTFETSEAAISWETRVLHRLHIPHNPNYLNQGKNHPQSQTEKEESFFNKYGVRFPFHVEEIKQKARETLERHYGADAHNPDGAIAQKARDTLMKRYGVEHTWLIPGVVDKSVQSRLDRFGVEYSMQSPELLEKSRNTQQEKFGGWRVRSTDVVQSVKNTNMEKYGVDNPFKIKGFAKEAAQRKYGVDNWSQTQAGKDAIKAGWAAREPMVCPHCNKASVAYSNMKRWHFDNCKLKSR